MFVFIIFVTIGDNLDIYLSSFFYYGEQQFALQSFDIITILARKVYMPILLIYILRNL